MNTTTNEKYDLHFHTMISRKLPFSHDHLHAMIDSARRKAIRTVALTDHIESPDYETVHRYVRNTFDTIDGGYDADGVWIVPGAEVETADDVHVLFLGEQPNLAELHSRLRPDIRAGRFPSVKELLQMSRPLSLLTVWAHPFRFVGASRDHALTDILDEELIGEFDAIDFNAEDLSLCRNEMESLLRRAAAYHSLPLVGGSDAHHPSQVGSVFNFCAERASSIGDLLRMIKRGSMEPRCAPTLAEQVARATEFKRRKLTEAFPG